MQNAKCEIMVDFRFGENPHSFRIPNFEFRI